MKKNDKTREQFLKGLKKSNKRIAEMEKNKFGCKNIEEMQRSSEREKEIILDSLIEHVIFEDKKMKILWANKAACESAGLTREELVGCYCYEIWPKRNKPCPDCPVLKAMKTIKPQEIEKSTPDGRVWFIRGYPTQNEKGDIVGGIEVTFDITKRKLVEEELEKHRKHLEELVKERTGEAERSQKSLVLLLEDVNEINQELRNANTMLNATNKELEAFTYSVSHDLRAPLTRMDGFSKVLIDSYSSNLDDKAVHYLSRIRASNQHMAKLIDDLLSLSRITREKVTRQKADLSLTAGKIANELKASEPGRKVDFEIAKGLSANADRKFVIIILENLLGNAFKFTGKKKNTIIKFGKKIINKKKVFFIKDNGAGFNMKYYDKIFTAFQRLHSNEEYKGSGIGLAIVQRIINKHGGIIWAESEEGKGTTFYFRFE